jgi:hypothetical protein
LVCVPGRQTRCRPVASADLRECAEQLRFLTAQHVGCAQRIGSSACRERCVRPARGLASVRATVSTPSSGTIDRGFHPAEGRARHAAENGGQRAVVSAPGRQSVRRTPRRNVPRESAAPGPWRLRARGRRPRTGTGAGCWCPSRRRCSAALMACTGRR